MRTRIIAGLLLVPLLILIIVGGTPLYCFPSRNETFQ